ncbi:hypothetical protein ACFC58_31315 [Kitasatospora purpeofusca]
MLLMRHGLGWSDTRITRVTGLDRAALATATRTLAGAACPAGHVRRRQ